MRNVHTLKDISSGHRLGSAREMELEEMLRNSIKSISELTIAELSNPPIPPMNDSSQKLPGWVSDDLRPLVYERGLEDKVMELDKSFTREHILEALQELLDTLPNQTVHSRPAHFEKSISREEVAKQSGGAEVVPSSQVMPLEGPSRTAPAIPAIESSFMSYAILTLFLLVVIWIVGKKIWDSWKKSNTEYFPNYFLSSPGISEAGLYNRRRKFEDRN